LTATVRDATWGSTISRSPIGPSAPTRRPRRAFLLIRPSLVLVARASDQGWPIIPDSLAKFPPRNARRNFRAFLQITPLSKSRWRQAQYSGCRIFVHPNRVSLEAIVFCLHTSIFTGPYQSGRQKTRVALSRSGPTTYPVQNPEECHVEYLSLAHAINRC